MAVKLPKITFYLGRPNMYFLLHKFCLNMNVPTFLILYLPTDYLKLPSVKQSSISKRLFLYISRFYHSLSSSLFIINSLKQFNRVALAYSILRKTPVKRTS